MREMIFRRRDQAVSLCSRVFQRLLLTTQVGQNQQHAVPLKMCVGMAAEIAAPKHQRMHQ